MPTVVIASPKGGAGKSTTAVILGTEFAHAGAEVTMMDCDPNGSLTLWSDRGQLPERISVLSGVKEAEIIKAIKAHDQDGRIVVVDLEGVASRLVSRAISQADLVIIPMRATTLDATIGVRALELIAEEAEALDREIPHAVVFTMTRAIQSKQHKGIVTSLKGQGVDVIEPELMERAAFSALFEFGGDLYSMPEQGKADKAIENAQGFAQAVFQRLTGGHGNE
ncbi:ParA family protein [Pseudogemmobacter faecipullorum]|uniref:ParA family protein n=1 Tax=Pseudogemmobacter faecipullorum TaxID=2755041 RepID=A0ABS8CS01_9RHOB|nr:ParA family protein [Pseudogemmobacter faecipullorum]MCB5412173.1 ParA family protein [Pseudogemmobacter faecipullorum]